MPRWRNGSRAAFRPQWSQTMEVRFLSWAPELVVSGMARSYHAIAGSKYTAAILSPIISASFSRSDVLKRLGLKPTGSNFTRLKAMISNLRLDTSHFVHRKSLPSTKLSWQTVLVLDRSSGGRKEDVRILRRALIESGVPETCEECGMGPTWNGRPIRLQIDHRNGNCIDNRPGNPRFLCPNCHSQTDTFGFKNVSIPIRFDPRLTGPVGDPILVRMPESGGRIGVEVECTSCKNRVLIRRKSFKVNKRGVFLCSPECRGAYFHSQRSIGNWPESDDLASLVWKMPISKLAIMVGVSDVAVLKRCRKLGIPTPRVGYWSGKSYPDVAQRQEARA